MGPQILPLLLEVPEAQLADLRRRLLQTRWPGPEPVPDWSQGVPLGYLRDLCRYWADGYDWRATEARLNALPQFQTEIDGIRIVFAHVRSPRPDALPLILTHGWPGSVIEFGKVIGPLSDPAACGDDGGDAFHGVRGRVGLRVLRGTRHAAADGRVRPGRLARVPGRLDRGKVLVLDRP